MHANSDLIYQSVDLNSITELDQLRKTQGTWPINVVFFKIAKNFQLQHFVWRFTHPENRKKMFLLTCCFTEFWSRYCRVLLCSNCILSYLGRVVKVYYFDHHLSLGGIAYNIITIDLDNIPCHWTKTNLVQFNEKTFLLQLKTHLISWQKFFVQKSKIFYLRSRIYCRWDTDWNWFH